jgi:hypothetical protein
MIHHVNTRRTARSQREITGLPAFAAAPRVFWSSHHGPFATAFGDDPRNPVTDQFARFALAAIDGAFVAIQADHGATLGRLLEPLAPSLVASRRPLLAGQGREGQAQAGRRI